MGWGEGYGPTLEKQLNILENRILKWGGGGWFFCIFLRRTYDIALQNSPTHEPGFIAPHHGVGGDIVRQRGGGEEE